ncbi:MAG: hypothetical protein O2945_03680 [Planctomycetota bacterium]|nr:hypothetical protein [Planctomycetota bacterium]MDA0918156.1 hypothetical protein [Planctomycetota bacterium]
MSDFKNNLVQTADAAARVGVLFVAVALFAAMWESDSAPTEAGDDHWLARRAGGSAVITQITGGEFVVDDERNGPTDLQSSPLSLSPLTETSLPYPMPAGIVPGDYRVVDSFGKAWALYVTEEKEAAIKVSPERDQFIVEDGSRTIYFIRIRGLAVGTVSESTRR